MPAIYRFAEFEVRPESGELFRNGNRVRIQEQSLQVLVALVENPGAVVTRDQLCKRLWPDGTYVDFEHSLNAAVKRLRSALEDVAETPRLIETLPRRGYRLMVEVSTQDPMTPPPTAIDTTTTAKPHPKYIWTLAAVALLIAVGSLVIVVRWGIPTLFSERNSARSPAPPRNSEAYELYLRSLGYRYEYPANGQAIQLLERSTALDARSARSWYELARRYDIEFTNAGRGHGFAEQARDANRRALQLAPEFSPARMQKIMLEVEAGQVLPAYHAALEMTQAWPEDANAHFALSYALRHGGMYEEAARECDLGLKLDPSNNMFRSCSLVYVLVGRYDRVRAYVDRDPLSTFLRFRRMELGLITNDRPAALDAVRAIRVGPHDYPDARMVEAVLTGAHPETVRQWSRDAEALFDRIDLPEAHFVDARYQSWAGQTEPALRLLRRAIANKYCSYPVMDSDPLLANIRRLPEYQVLKQSAIECAESFRAEIDAR